MKQLSLGITLAFFLCLPIAALAEPSADTAVAPLADPSAESKPAAPLPKNTRPVIGSEVPQFSALAAKTFYSLGALTVFFLLVAGTFKRFAQKRGTTKCVHQIEILARKPVGTRHALLLVSVNGQKFFLSQGTEEIRLLSELDEETMFRDSLDETLQFLDHPHKVANGDKA